jgi:hypothetical protein
MLPIMIGEPDAAATDEGLELALELDEPAVVDDVAAGLLLELQAVANAATEATATSAPLRTDFISVLLMDWFPPQVPRPRRDRLEPVP